MQTYQKLCQIWAQLGRERFRHHCLVFDFKQFQLEIIPPFRHKTRLIPSFHSGNFGFRKIPIRWLVILPSMATNHLHILHTTIRKKKARLFTLRKNLENINQERVSWILPYIALTSPNIRFSGRIFSFFGKVSIEKQSTRFGFSQLSQDNVTVRGDADIQQTWYKIGNKRDSFCLKWEILPKFFMVKDYARKLQILKDKTSSSF